MRDDRIPAQFFIYGVIATALVVASILLRWSTGWIFFAILAPLGAYIFHVITNRHRYGANVADSVYYFGFGLTVITLAWSAIFHFGGATHSDKDIHTVFTQFGAGLIATCVGLIARLWTIAIFEHDAKTRPDATHTGALEAFATEVLATRNDVAFLRDAIEKLSASMAASSEQLDTMMESSRAHQERVHKESLQKFREVVSEAAADFQNATSVICDQLRAINLAEDAQGFHDAVKKIRGSADTFVKHSGAASEAIGDLKSHVQALSGASVDAGRQLGTLGAGIESAGQSAAALDRVTGSLLVTQQRLAAHADDLATQLASQQRSIAALSQGHEKSLKDAQSAVNQVVDALEQVAREVSEKVAQ